MAAVLVAEKVDAGLRSAMSGPLGWAHSRRRRIVAANDPDYADRLSRRERESRSSFPIDELIHDHRLAEAVPGVWWEPAVRFLASGPTARAVRQVGWGWQRLTRGWDDRATWALDVHLARTLGAQLIHLADTTHGWPGNEEFPEPEDWDAALRRHGATLLAYPGVVYDAVDEAPIEAAQESVRWVADHLPDLWD